jgi:hypothetical protein
MNSEQRTCLNCKSGFTIEAEDFEFCAKIQVPPPTWCPTCRQKRRYAWRNERVLYRRNCDLCGKSMVTIYSSGKPYKVYCPPCWWSDAWDTYAFGRSFDFGRPFFEQFRELQKEVPRMGLLTKNSENCEYVNHGTNNKNCYLSFAVIDCENIMYSANAFGGARDCMDCYWIEDKVERSYECISTYSSYACQYSMLLNSCANCSYCYDCRGCSNCFMSYNLRNKQYYILNQPYSREEYLKKIEEFRLASFASRQKLYAEYLEMMQSRAIHRFAVQEQSANVSGNLIFQSKNTHHAFDVYRMEDSKRAVVSLIGKNVADTYHAGYGLELVYESHAIIRGYHTLFSHLSYDNADISYCDTCHNSQNLFGCVSVKKGTHCILNKQYGEEEYAALRGKIISHMKTTGEFGEFFPPALSPFGYNETQGQVYMPMSKQEALIGGWKWEDQLPGTFGKETLPTESIPDSVADVSDAILKEVLRCAQCSKNYNIVQPELQFYRKENVPVPHLCPDCRYARRNMLRPPRNLWHRPCMCNGTTSSPQAMNHPSHTGDCPNEFETPYDPDRPETVYCEPCYLAEVV